MWFGETSVRGNVIRELSVGKMSVRRIARSGNCPLGKCPSRRCLRGTDRRGKVLRGNVRRGTVLEPLVPNTKEVGNLFKILKDSSVLSKNKGEQLQGLIFKFETWVIRDSIEKSKQNSLLNYFIMETQLLIMLDFFCHFIFFVLTTILGHFSGNPLCMISMYITFFWPKVWCFRNTWNLSNISLLTLDVHQKVICIETKMQLPAASLFKYVWPWSGHQALKSLLSPTFY